MFKLMGKKIFTLVQMYSQNFCFYWTYDKENATVLPAKSDSDVMFCLQSYQGLRIDRSLVY